MSAAEIFNAAEPEADPERRAAQVFLAIAKSVCPAASPDEVVLLAAHLDPQAAAMNPALVADVAARMDLAAR